jgi:membrane protein insertase Oxa1/YidC/SpoIIIJ
VESWQRWAASAAAHQQFFLIVLKGINGWCTIGVSIILFSFISSWRSHPLRQELRVGQRMQKIQPRAGTCSASIAGSPQLNVELNKLYKKAGEPMGGCLPCCCRCRCCLPVPILRYSIALRQAPFAFC